jgi:hypothetical protein
MIRVILSIGILAQAANRDEATRTDSGRRTPPPLRVII